MSKFRKGERGFTLVELLVVIAIIGVLATLVLLQLGTARAKARDVKRISDINQIRSAVEQYFEDEGGNYPIAISDALLGKYILKVPKDPLTGVVYEYSYDTVNSKLSRFRIAAYLEGFATALGSDADIAVAGWTVAGTDIVDDEAACKTTVANCQYDQGTK